MNVASLELCKELYELSGWDYTGLCYAENKQGWFLESGNVFDNYGAEKQWGCVAAYDLGYLMRKLPKYYAVWRNTETWKVNYVTEALRLESDIDADTPEDAVCRLAIELFKQGVLHSDNV